MHDDLIDEHGGTKGVRDMGLVESALAMPGAGPGDEYFHPFPFGMAAAYAFHIAENQPFLDGNKRTGVACAVTFLVMNGFAVKDPKMELYQAILKVASKGLLKEGLAEILERLTQTPREMF